VEGSGNTLARVPGSTLVWVHVLAPNQRHLRLFSHARTAGLERKNYITLRSGERRKSAAEAQEIPI
jgi:hypothetical protein